MAETTTAAGAAPSPVRLGLRENWRQFALLLLVNAFVGGMVGLERTVVPLIGSEEFGLASTTVIASFIASLSVFSLLRRDVSIIRLPTLTTRPPIRLESTRSLSDTAFPSAADKADRSSLTCASDSGSALATSAATSPR